MKKRKLITSIITLLVGIATFLSGFILYDKFVQFIVNNIQNNDLQIIMKIIMWIIGFTVVLGLSFWIAIGITALLLYLINKI